MFLHRHPANYKTLQQFSAPRPSAFQQLHSNFQLMKYLFTILFCSFCAMSLAQTPASSKNRDVVFSDVTIIPMDANRVVAHQTVITRNGKITSDG
jgi:hypothetical protein